MATAQQIINEALKYEGEGGSRFQNAAGMPGQPWCAMFVWYVFKQVGASSLYCGGQGICSVEGIYSYYTGQSLFSQDPKPGDLVLYDWANTTGRFNHVGIVISADANYIYTIEGNTLVALWQEDSVQETVKSSVTAIRNILEQPEETPVVELRAAALLRLIRRSLLVLPEAK